MIRNLLLALAVIVLCLLGATLIGSEYRLKRKTIMTDMVPSTCAIQMKKNSFQNSLLNGYSRMNW